MTWRAWVTCCSKFPRIQPQLFSDIQVEKGLAGWLPIALLRRLSPKIVLRLVHVYAYLQTPRVRAG